MNVESREGRRASTEKVFSSRSDAEQSVQLGNGARRNVAHRDCPPFSPNVGSSRPVVIRNNGTRICSGHGVPCSKGPPVPPRYQETARHTGLPGPIIRGNAVSDVTVVSRFV